MECDCEINEKKFNCKDVFEHQYAFSDTASKDIKTVMMSPKDFLEETYKQSEKVRQKQYKREMEAKGYSLTKPHQKYEEYLKGIIDEKNVEGIKNVIKKRFCLCNRGRNCLPIPFLTFDEKGNSTQHEGRHTSKAAEDVGLKEIPVTIEKPKGVKTDFDNLKPYKEQYGRKT